jgi:D-alanyl-D-alanine carboxypeptidase
MMDSFRREKGIDNILLCSGYRSTEQQQGLYDEDLAETGLDYSLRVALPGYSEHETGYALDLDIVEGEYDGTGDYAYIDRICKSFGYILRYTADKTNITKIEYEPWHYRYVGVPHASYITDNRLVLEEYIAILEELYNFSNGDLLETTAPDGVVYGIYYYDMENLGFNVPVPSDKEYSISGTNTGGVVITFDTGKRGDYKAVMDENLKNLSENYLSKVMPTETQTDTEEDTTLWSWEDEGGIDYEGNDDGSYDGGDNGDSDGYNEENGEEGNGDGGDNSGGDGDDSESGDDFVPEIADVGSEKSFGSVTTPPPKETSKKKYVPVEYDV